MELCLCQGMDKLKDKNMSFQKNSNYKKFNCSKYRTYKIVFHILRRVHEKNVCLKLKLLRIKKDRLFIVKYL